MTDKLKKAALFICTLIVLTVSLLWVAWGIRENSRYHRITAKITEISEFSTENSNFYKNKSDNEKYTAAYVTYKYKASNSISSYMNLKRISMPLAMIIIFIRLTVGTIL